MHNRQFWLLLPLFFLLPASTGLHASNKQATPGNYYTAVNYKGLYVSWQLQFKNGKTANNLY